MKNALEYIQNKYKLNIRQRRQPLEIPNTTREDLARLFCELGFTRGAEIGVERGIYSKVLLDVNPELYLYSVDAWKAYKGYRDHTTQKTMDEIYTDCTERLKPYEKRNTMMKMFSMDAIKQFDDESLDFVYLDGNHEFQHVVNDLCEWEKKVKVGGIVAGHDYIRRKTNGYLMHVPMAIHGFIESYQIKPLFVLGRKTAKANLNPKRELRDSTRSWFYVKPPRDPMRPGHQEKPLDNE